MRTTDAGAGRALPTFTVDALLFDLDGTLIDSTAATERAWLSRLI